MAAGDSDTYLPRCLTALLPDCPASPATGIGSMSPPAPLLPSTGSLTARSPAVAQLAGSVVFVDVSGFTQLANAMVDDNDPRAACEELTRVLNEYISKLVRCLHEWGLDILFFAGDSIVALSPTLPGEGADGAAARGAAAALSVQRVVFERDGHALNAHTGLGTGELHVYAVRASSGARYELLYAGSALKGAIDAQAASKGTEIVLSAGTAACLEGRVAARRLLDRAAPGAPPLFLMDSFEPNARPAPLSAASHAGWRRRGLPARGGGGRGGGGQHEPAARDGRLPRLPGPRPRGGGPDEAAAAARHAEACAAVVRRVHAAAEGEYGGCVSKFLQDDKGATCLVCFGLPGGFTHEDDAERAVLFALALERWFESTQRPFACGIAAGRTFCGRVGASCRQEYATIGEAVNLAARGRCWGGAGGEKGGEESGAAAARVTSVLCDEAVAAAVRAGAARYEVAFHRLPPLRLKGYTRDVAAFRPAPEWSAGEAEAGGNRRASLVLGRQGDVEVVGRAVELAAIRAACVDLLQGRGSTVILRGPAGHGNPLHAAVPFAALRSLLVCAGLDLAAEPALRADLTRRDVDRPMQAARLLWRYVLGHGLTEEGRGGEELPGPSIHVRTAFGRAQAIARIFVRLIRAVTHSPVAVLVEDAHFLCSSSWAVLREIRRNCTNVLVVLATRPMSDPPHEFKFLCGDEAERAAERAALQQQRSGHLQPGGSISGGSTPKAASMGTPAGGHATPPLVARAALQRAAGGSPGGMATIALALTRAREAVARMRNRRGSTASSRRASASASDTDSLAPPPPAVNNWSGPADRDEAPHVAAPALFPLDEERSSRDASPQNSARGGLPASQRSSARPLVSLSHVAVAGRGSVSLAGGSQGRPSLVASGGRPSLVLSSAQRVAEALQQQQTQTQQAQVAQAAQVAQVAGSVAGESVGEREGPAPPQASHEVPVQILEVEPLTDKAAYLLVRSRLGAAAERFSREALAAVVEKSRGIALFLVELSRQLLQMGEAEAGSFAASAVPSSIEGVVLSRVDTLPRDAQALLRLAAVAGPIFTLEAAMAADPKRLAQREALTALEHLVGASFVEPLGSAPLEGPAAWLAAEHGFVHALVRDAVYEATPNATRQRLHLNVALWLEARAQGRRLDKRLAGPAGEPDGDASRAAASEAAALYHHIRASGDTQRALAYLERSAREAYEANALREARDGYRELHRQLDALGLDAALPARPDLRNVPRSSWRRPASRDRGEKGGEASDPSSPSTGGSTGGSGRSRNSRGGKGSGGSTVSGHDPLAWRSMRLRSLQYWVFAEYHAGRLDIGLELARRLLEACGQALPRPGAATALRVLARLVRDVFVRRLPAPVPFGPPAAGPAGEGAPGRGGGTCSAVVWEVLAWLAIVSGDTFLGVYGALRAYAMTAFARGGVPRDSPEAPVLGRMQAMLAFVTGLMRRRALSDRLLANAAAIGEALDDDSVRGAVAMQRGMRAASFGRMEEARDAFGESTRLNWEVGAGPCGEAWGCHLLASITLGELEEARAPLAECWDFSRRVGSRQLTLFLTVVFGWSSWFRGHDEGVQEWVLRGNEVRVELGEGGALWWIEASLLCLEGLATWRCEQDAGKAARLLERCLAVWRDNYLNSLWFSTLQFYAVADWAVWCLHEIQTQEPAGPPLMQPTEPDASGGPFLAVSDGQAVARGVRELGRARVERVAAEAAALLRRTARLLPIAAPYAALVAAEHARVRSGGRPSGSWRRALRRASAAFARDGHRVMHVRTRPGRNHTTPSPPPPPNRAVQMVTEGKLAAVEGGADFGASRAVEEALARGLALRAFAYRTDPCDRPLPGPRAYLPCF
eukprot:tig00020848_g14536.t1